MCMLLLCFCFCFSESDFNYYSIKTVYLVAAIWFPLWHTPGSSAINYHVFWLVSLFTCSSALSDRWTFFGPIFFQKKPKDQVNLKIPPKDQADKTEPQVKRPKETLSQYSAVVNYYCSHPVLRLARAREGTKWSDF